MLISVIEQFRQLSWAIRALIASYYQQIGANLAVEDRSSVENRGHIEVGPNIALSTSALMLRFVIQIMIASYII